MKNLQHIIICGFLAIVLMGFSTALYSQNDSIPADVELKGELIDSSYHFCSTPPLARTATDDASSGIGEKRKLWRVGQTVRVRFIDGSTFLKNKVRQYASQWEQYANIKLEFVQSGFAEIRISFARKGAFYSQIGTNSLNFDQKSPTMNLGFRNGESETSFRRLILHEFGHAMGLHHEHQHPDNTIQWNRPATYAYYAATQGWSRSTVDQQVFGQRTAAANHFCSYDQRSIMHYSIPPSITLNNKGVPLNSHLSAEDRSFISKAYPAGGTRNDPICGACTNCESDYSLTTSISGRGSISITRSNGSKSTCTSTCTNTYERNENVSLQAIPQQGYQFVRWSGTSCNNGESVNCSVRMNNSQSVTAIFQAVVSSKQLTVEVVQGGSVEVTVEKVTRDICTSNCTYSFTERSSIKLTAKPLTGYRFVNWQGDVCNTGTNSNCPLTLIRDLQVKANFEPIITASANLTLRIVGAGSITAMANNTSQTCNSICAIRFLRNTSVEVLATPAEGYRFKEWIGLPCNTVTDTNCRFVLNNSRSVTAVFEPVVAPTVNLTLQVVGSGQISATSNGAVQTCNTHCAINYEQGAAVELMASPSDGYRFKEWEGSLCNGVNMASCSFTLDASRNITAVFERIITNTNCISFTAQSTNTTCNTGSVSIRIQEGVPPFTIRVEGPISGDATTISTAFRIEDLLAGNYQIKIMDARGCDDTKSFSIVSNCNNIATESSSRSLSLNQVDNNQILPPTALIAHADYQKIELEQGPKAPATSLLQGINRLSDFSEAHNHAHGTGRQCGSSSFMATLLQDLEMEQKHQQKQKIFEEDIQLRGNCTDKIVLPVAIHFQDVTNVNRVCLEEMARRQIETLNQDFQGTNKEIATWNNSVARLFPGVENGEACLDFCIATRNHPTGFGLQEGRLAVTINQTTGNVSKDWVGYINIFVRPLNNFLGFSPVGGSGRGDGVIISTQAFGSGATCGSVRPTSPYHLGRTLTHEIGHYLLLGHIWGDGCGSDDRITDTPSSSEPYGGCPSLNSTSCGSRDLHINYMDYTDDACLYMFTAGQCSIMERYVEQSLSHVVNNATRVCEVEETITQVTKYDLNISVVGTGTIEVQIADRELLDCAATCASTIEENQMVRLMAVPAEGYRFSRWTGTRCNNLTSTKCNFMMTRNHQIVAVFEPTPVITNTLTVEVEKGGIVQVSENTSIQVCEENCQYSFENNTNINLVAEPAMGYTFDKWESTVCDNSTTTNCSFTLANDQVVKAIFKKENTLTDCISFMATTSNTTCNTGLVSIRVQEGDAPFTIRVTGPISGDATTDSKSFRIEDFPAGTYNMKLTDAEGCESTEEFTVALTCDQNGFSGGTSNRIVTIEEEVPSFKNVQMNHITHTNHHLCTAQPLDSTYESTGALGVAPKKYLWENGQTIRVQMIGGEQWLRNKIMQGAREWEKYANIKFQFVNTVPAEIRIGFRKTINNSSQIGTEALLVEKTRTTMNFSLTRNQPEEFIQWVIRHEFGHALGLLHEHLHPENTIQWDKPAVYEWQKALSKKDVDNQFFNLYEEDTNYFCAYDPESVMHYSISNDMTLNDFSVPSEASGLIYNLISKEDKRIIGELYPFNKDRNDLACGFCSKTESCSRKRLEVSVTGKGRIRTTEPDDKMSDCMAICTKDYEAGTTIQLEAIPDVGYRFVRWMGDGCAEVTNGTCMISMEEDRNITAVFESVIVITEQALKIRVEGEGQVRLKAATTTHTCQGSCTYTYAGTLLFDLEAMPAEGYQLARWEGNYCTDNTQLMCQFEIAADATVTAIFEPIPEACFSFAVTPTNTDCDRGVISIKVEEGMAPYAIQVKGPLSGEASTDSKLFKIEGLPSGGYEMILTDAAGCKVTESFMIDNTCTEEGLVASTARSRTANSIVVVDIAEVPITENLVLDAAYPNPFREGITIPFHLTKGGDIQFTVFDGTGKKVHQLNQHYEAGKNQIALSSQELPQAGLYFYHLSVGKQLVTGKMMRVN